ncbi:hypothetical protein NKH93_25790 [Mesorhizobium sp. M0954]|uniref:hypothetical protein n=1 Tax=Mesorhizobium sp. M0954 TaxID=2957032 RepID=UPI00333BB676
MYEVGAGGPHARVVRHSRIRNIVRRGHELAFTFEPDPKHAFLDRSAVLRIADRLGIQQFKQHRTHWAIKDGDIPAELIATSTAERAQRTVAVVAAEYVEARREGRRREAAELAEELEDFPPSLEKALSLVPARILQQPTPEIIPDPWDRAPHARRPQRRRGRRRKGSQWAGLAYRLVLFAGVVPGPLRQRDGSGAP